MPTVMNNNVVPEEAPEFVFDKCKLPDIFVHICQEVGDGGSKIEEFRSKHLMSQQQLLILLVCQHKYMFS